MHDRQRPGQIGGDMHDTPGGRPPGEPAPGDASGEDHQHQVGGQRAEAEVERPAARQEGRDRVDRARAMRQYLHQHMSGQESHRGQGERTVRRLRPHPAGGGHDDAVRRDHPRRHRGGQGDQREYARVEERKALRRGEDRPVRAGAASSRRAAGGGERGRDQDPAPAPRASSSGSRPCRVPTSS